jgi:CBS domain-containing protein
MKNLKVRDLMTAVVLSVHPDDTVETVYDLMIERAEVPVFLMREILRRTRVEEVMTSEVETAGPDTPASEAARIMFENKFGCLPVLESSKLVGILTESDFVRFFCDDAVGQAEEEPAKASGRARAGVLGWFS